MKVKIREPLEFFWNLIFPFFTLFLLNFSKMGQYLHFNELIYLILPYLSWISFQSSVYGVGLNLVAWREMGFLKTIMHNKANKFNLICSFVIIQLIIASFYYSCFWIVSFLLFNVGIQMSSVFIGLPAFLLVEFILSLASLILTVIPTSYSSISTIVSILIMPMIWISSQNLNSAWIMRAINLFNPVYYVYQMLEMIYIRQNIDFKEIGIKSFVLVIFSFVGILKLQKKSSYVR
jgi:hypothetical protein